MSKPMIGVLDCNNFFVSCERLFRPDLINKPVVVLSSNDGCVIARSKEIKDIGVPMGVPYFHIKDTLKKADAVTFSTHFALYRDISRRVFSVMRDELGEIEQYSIDEAFFPVVGSPAKTAKRIKSIVEKKVGIPVSIGVAPTKTLAKYASKKAKKNDGVFVIDDANWNTLSESVKLSEIWGVGGSSELKYKANGLKTARDLMEADKGSVATIFGKHGVLLRQELIGESVYKIGDRVESKKGIISSRSFKKTTDSLEVLSDSVAYHVRHAVAELRSLGLKAGSVRVTIQPSRHGDFVLRGGSKERILSISTNDSIQLMKVAMQLLESIYEPGVPYKKAGISLGGFVPAEVTQDSLFAENKQKDNQLLMETIDSINKITDKELVMMGSRLMGSAWQSQSKNSSPAYTTRWSDIMTVKAK